MRIQLKAFLFLAGTILLPALNVAAADYTVDVYPNNLIPAQLTITTADTVTFVNHDFTDHYLQNHANPAQAFWLFEEDTLTLEFSSAGSFRIDDVLGGTSVRITVTAATTPPSRTMTMSAPTFTADGKLVMGVSGMAVNSKVTLQTSTNLVDWQDVTTITATSTSISVTIPIPSSGMALYRLKGP